MRDGWMLFMLGLGGGGVSFVAKWISFIGFLYGFIWMGSLFEVGLSLAADKSVYSNCFRFIDM